MKIIRIMQYAVVSGMILAVVAVIQVPSFAEAAKEDTAGMKSSHEKHGSWDKEKWEAKKAAIHKELGITEEQEGQLKAYRQQHQSQVKAVKEEIKQKRDEIRQELQKDEMDLARVKQLHEELKALKMKKEDSRLEAILDVRGVLTPEQFKKFSEMKDKMKDGRKGGMHGSKGSMRDSGDGPGDGPRGEGPPKESE